MTLVVNPLGQVVWEYSYTFNSYCEIDGIVYGANDNGLFAIDTGDLDDTTPISSVWTFGKLSFADTNSRVSGLYVGATGNGDLNISLATDDDEPVDYAVSPRLEDRSHRYRVVTAKGAKGRYWQLSASNVDGCDFRVDDIIADVAPSMRRI